jgi:hypothetical protein
MNKRETRKSAALEYQPWEAGTIKKMERDFSADDWSLKPDSPIAVDLRLATVIMSKTKAELVDIARELDTGVLELTDHLRQTEDALRALADIVASAASRQQIAAAVYAMECWGEGNDLRWTSSRGTA